MERRDFLRGVLLSGTAGMVAPAVANIIGEERAEAAQLAVVTNEDLALDSIEGIAGGRMMHRLRKRVNAHIELFGEPPKALFVNRYEFRLLVDETMPVARYSNSKLMDMGYLNLLVANVPVMCVESDVLYVQPEMAS